MFFFSSKKKKAFENIISTEIIQEILNAPDDLSVASSSVSTEETFELCQRCKNSTQITMRELNNIPEKVFEINKSPIDYIKQRVITPKLNYKYVSDFAKDEFFDVHRKQGDTLKKIPSVDGKYLIFSYVHSEFTKNKFFAIYSQKSRLHYCNYHNFNFVRKSEIHRSVPFIKLLPSSQHIRYYSAIRIFIIIYSYSQDLYVNLPRDDFFVNKISKDPNEKIVLRVKKSSPESFNYIMTNKETIQNAQIYGKYQTEQVITGKFGSGHMYKIEDVIENYGYGLIHSTILHEEKSKIKLSALPDMIYACSNYEKLIEPKRIRKKKIIKQ